MDNQLNIIYVVCHDLGKHLGCYGARVNTPNLDRFAKQGSIFTNAFCTAPACTPSRACAMTGMYSHTSGVMGLAHRGWSMSHEVRTVVDYFNEAGYETAHFGLQHERNGAKDNRYQIEGWASHNDEYVECAIEKAIDYLENRRDIEKPFYLNIGTAEVHATKWQGNFKGSRTEVYGIVPDDKVYMPPCTTDVPQVRIEMAKFQACVEYVDLQIQRLFDVIERKGYLENTVVIFTTDHGISNMRAKGWLYDRGVEITLLMHIPDKNRFKLQIHDLVANIDLAPTILEACGITIPTNMQGTSIWKRVTGKEPGPVHEEIFTERNHHNDYDPMRAIRTTQFHYIHNFGRNAKKAWLPDEIEHMNESYNSWFTELWPQMTLPRDEVELYDIMVDPDEVNNLAGNPQYSMVKQELATKLWRWMKETKDPLLNIISV